MQCASFECYMAQVGLSSRVSSKIRVKVQFRVIPKPPIVNPGERPHDSRLLFQMACSTLRERDIAWQNVVRMQQLLKGSNNPKVLKPRECFSYACRALREASLAHSCCEELVASWSAQQLHLPSDRNLRRVGYLLDVRARQEQVAGAEVADGAAVGQAAGQDAQTAQALRRVRCRPTPCHT